MRKQNIDYIEEVVVTRRIDVRGLLKPLIFVEAKIRNIINNKLY